MRLISARFRGLKGVYSKSGQKEIFIDFTKCIHNIIYIVGKNGSGKSTLMNALNPLPDSPQMYLEHELGEKEIVYSSDNINYSILIQYPVYANGTRATTKAYFKQLNSDGTILELNANGTVGSFKDILYSKFNLDPNFVSLSQLSSEDRGLVDKKPAERKKFIGNLLESVEIYNDIYKTLVKRSGVFKSMVNSITAKIDSIGDEQKLLINKTAADNRLNALEQQRRSLEQQIASSKATIKVIDPDDVIQSKYKKLFGDLEQIKTNLSILTSALSQNMNVNSLEDATKEYSNWKEVESNLVRDIDITKSSLEEILITREEESKIIFIKNQKYSSMISESNLPDLKKTLTEYNKKIFEYEQIFKRIGVAANILTKDEYILGLNTLENLRTSILNIKSYASESAIQIACVYILNNDNFIAALNTDKKSLEECKSSIEHTKEQISFYNGVLRRVQILENRPSDCILDHCSFIKDALEAQQQEPQKQLDLLETKLQKLYDDRRRLVTIIEQNEDRSRVYNDLKILLRTIESSKSIIKKLPNGDIFGNTTEFIKRVKNGDTFNDIYSLYQYIEYANIFELYDHDKKIQQDLESEYRILKGKESVIDELQAEIDQLVKKLEGIDKKIQEKQILISDKQKELITCRDQINKIDQLIVRYRKIEELTTLKSEIESQLSLVSGNIEKISAEISNINQCNSQLQGIINELAPLNKMKDEYSYSLTKLTEYKAELQSYNDQYSLVELLKKYSSPTKGGIQTIFMQLYMDKTLSLSNQLLSMMFDGEMELLPYVINENEFRIPMRNSITNLITDDISNCSTSERSMIAMIMSFVLLYQGSSIYNIIKLDEIDGGLDQKNRSMFPMILTQIMNILSVEHCLIVSHSSEADMSNVDVISLTPVSHETMKGNVIFQLQQIN